MIETPKMPSQGEKSKQKVVIDYSKKYWWIGAILIPMLVALIAKWPTGDTKLAGATFITNISVMEQQHLSILGHSLNDPVLKEDLQHAIEQGLRGDWASAIDLFTKIAQQAPLPSVYNNLGVLYEGTNDPVRAQQAYEKALQKDSSYEPAMSNLTRLGRRRAPLAKGSTQRSEQEPNNDRRSTTTIPMEEPVTGELSGISDWDYFQFATPAGPRDIFEIRLENESTSSLPCLVTYNSQGEKSGEVCAKNSGANVRQTLSAEGDKTYVVAVASSILATEGGSYTVQVTGLHRFDQFEPNDSFREAALVSSGGKTDAGMMDDLDVDFYRLELVESGATSFKIENHSDGWIPWIGVYNSMKELVGEKGGSNPGTDVELILPRASQGTYYVKVGRTVMSWGDSAGPYALTVMQ